MWLLKTCEAKNHEIKEYSIAVKALENLQILTRKSIHPYVFMQAA
jgi:hypothetical protein